MYNLLQKDTFCSIMIFCYLCCVGIQHRGREKTTETKPSSVTVSAFCPAAEQLLIRSHKPPIDSHYWILLLLVCMAQGRVYHLPLKSVDLQCSICAH